MANVYLWFFRSCGWLLNTKLFLNINIKAKQSDSSVEDYSLYMWTVLSHTNTRKNQTKLFMFFKLNNMSDIKGQ